MLDLNLIRENPVHFKDVLGKRGYLFDTKKLICGYFCLHDFIKSEFISTPS